MICGTGNGVAITANKHAGVRAGLCWIPEVAALVRQHNDANVLCIPARFVSMLDYCKTVLEKVHFDQNLFHKEYGKSLRWLSHEEGKRLREWLAVKFGSSNRVLFSQPEKAHHGFSPNLAQHEYTA